MNNKKYLSACRTYFSKKLVLKFFDFFFGFISLNWNFVLDGVWPLMWEHRSFRLVLHLLRKNSVTHCLIDKMNLKFDTYLAN